MESKIEFKTISNMVETGDEEITTLVSQGWEILQIDHVCTPFSVEQIVVFKRYKNNGDADKVVTDGA